VDQDAIELKMNSLSGSEPAVYQWPLLTGTGEVGSFFIAFILKFKKQIIFFPYSYRLCEIALRKLWKILRKSLSYFIHFSSICLNYFKFVIKN